MARRRAEPGIDRRQQILEAALDVFAEVGFEGATTKAIAARADVTQGLIYFYFPQGKEELFAAAFEHQAAIMIAQLDLDPLMREGPPQTVIPRFLARFMEVMSEQRCKSLMRLMTRATIGEQHYKRASMTKQMHFGLVAKHLTERLAAYLDEQVASGAVRPLNTALTAQLLLGAVMMLLVRRGKDDSVLRDLTPPELTALIADLVLHGLLAAPETGAVPRRKAAMVK
ncbi:MAG: TetR/AcrR family transcriptional regulator [Ktedonobacterales bacterium]